MNSKEFRKEVLKIMPGYRWTIHRTRFDHSHLSATGIQSSGFNRLSTLQIVRRETSSGIEYEVKSAGYGAKSPWVGTSTAPTLRRALRGLQEHYESMARLYSGCASYLESARQKTAEHDCPHCQHLAFCICE